jgi:uncharacterized protein (TIGR00255 family)
MTLSSMTGFARCNGASGDYAWAWELRSVNGKNLDLRLRLPPGWEGLESPLRARAAEMLSRGTIHATLAARREGVSVRVRVNEPVLSAVLSTLQEIAQKVDAAPARLDGILAIKGVVEVTDQEEDEEDRRAAEITVIAGFSDALAALAAVRRQEGAALAHVLRARLDEIGRLAQCAEAAPGRRPEAVRSRLAEQVAALLGTSDRFDPDRLHQEAILIAAKADVREELDRLAAHVQQGRDLLARGGAVGRRLDFLAQELQREANTLCAKANDVELTNIGLELKSIVEQFREQVQNLE